MRIARAAVETANNRLNDATDRVRADVEMKKSLGSKVTTAAPPGLVNTQSHEDARMNRTEQLLCDISQGLNRTEQGTLICAVLQVMGLTEALFRAGEELEEQSRDLEALAAGPSMVAPHATQVNSTEHTGEQNRT